MTEQSTETPPETEENPNSLFMLVMTSHHDYELRKIRSREKRTAYTPKPSPIKRKIPKKKPIKIQSSISTQTSECPAIFQELDEKTNEIRHLKRTFKKQERKIESYLELINEQDDELFENDNLIDQLKEEIQSLKQSEKEWIGRTLRFQYLGQQIKRIGIKQSEDIVDCFEDIEVPEQPLSIQNEYIPTILSNVATEEDEDGGIDEGIDEGIDDRYDTDDSGEFITVRDINGYGELVRLFNSIDNAYGSDLSSFMNGFLDNDITSLESLREYFLEFQAGNRMSILIRSPQLLPWLSEENKHAMIDWYEDDGGWVGSRVARYEDTSIIEFDSDTNLPWYESRFPTPLETDAAIRIQRFYKVRFEKNNNTNYGTVEDWDGGVDHY